MLTSHCFLTHMIASLNTSVPAACKKYVAQVKVRRGRACPGRASSGQRSSRLSCLIHYHPPPSRAVLIRMCFDHPGRIGRNVLSLKEGLGHGGRPWNQSGIVLSPLLIHEVHPSWAAPLHIPAHKKAVDGCLQQFYLLYYITNLNLQMVQNCDSRYRYLFPFVLKQHQIYHLRINIKYKYN